jgi:hypothetical protein
VHAELVIVAWHVLCCLTRRATAGPRAVDWDRWIKGWMDGWMDTVGPILRVDFWKASSIGHWWVRWVYSAAEPRGAWRPWSLLREGCAAGGLVTPRDHCGRARGDAFERLSHRVLLVCWLWNQSWVRAHIDAPSPPPPPPTPLVRSADAGGLFPQHFLSLLLCGRGRGGREPVAATGR